MSPFGIQTPVPGRVLDICLIAFAQGGGGGDRRKRIKRIEDKAYHSAGKTNRIKKGISLKNPQLQREEIKNDEKKKERDMLPEPPRS